MTTHEESNVFNIAVEGNFDDCQNLVKAMFNDKKFSKEIFKRFHKGGSLGRTLLLVKDIMVTGNRLPLINFKKKLNDALKVMNQKKLGIVVITKSGYVNSIITDGDLRREMKFLSRELKFEDAQFLKEKMIALESYQAKSTIVNPKISNVDVFSLKY